VGYPTRESSGRAGGGALRFITHQRNSGIALPENELNLVVCPTRVREAKEDAFDSAGVQPLQYLRRSVGSNYRKPKIGKEFIVELPSRLG
jgi:hypothetical protein